MPENVPKNFRKCLRNSSAARDGETSTLTSPKKSVKRKADRDTADDTDDQNKPKRAKVERVKPSSKKAKHVSLIITP